MKRMSAAVAALMVCGVARAEITLVGRAEVPGTARDRSGLTGTLGHGIPHDRLGGFGSGIAWTGVGNRYIAVDDRGPLDGAVAFRTRFQVMEIAVHPGSATAVAVEVVSTVLLSDERGGPLTGNADAFDARDGARDRRLDPEGVRVSARGTLFVSDEYGPAVDEFAMDGRRVRRLAVPGKFAVRVPSAEPGLEQPPFCVSGRQPNRGFEGLAISPDGSRVYAALQSPLIQDGALDEGTVRVGVNVRVLEIAVEGGATREFVYALEKPGHGVNEMVAVNGREFLVLERDGAEVKFRRLFRAGLDGATDVSAIAVLPSRGLPAGVTAIRKAPFLDFLDPRFGLAGAGMPEKIEGLAFGPDLPDGRRLLLVTTDNDFVAERASQIWAFAIDRGDLPGFEAQAIRAPAK